METYLGQTADIVLGEDFLTWLWLYSESAGGNFTTENGEPFLLYFEQKVTIKGGEGDSAETLSMGGRMSELTEAKIGLTRGKKVTRAGIRIERDNESWTFSVKSEDFAFSSYKTPVVDKDKEEGEDPDAAILEKIYLLERGLEAFDAVFKLFLQQRLKSDWRDEALRLGVKSAPSS